MLTIEKTNITLSGAAVNLPENIKLTNGYIVGICFKDSRHKEKFIGIFKSGDIRRLPKMLSADAEPGSHAIDYVDENVVESTLSVEEYLKFYGMLRNIYDVDFQGKAHNLLRKVNLIDKKDISMRELKRSQQKSVRVLASCLNNLLLFVGNNLLNEMDCIEKSRLYDVLSMYLKEIAVCIIIEDTRENLTGFADVIYEI